MYFEPVRKYAEDKKKHGKTEEHDPRHDADCVPYLACLRGDETVQG